MDQIDVAADHAAKAVRLLEHLKEEDTASVRPDVIATAQVYATLAVASAARACWQELHRLWLDQA